MLCDHPSIAYDIRQRVALPFRFVIHELKCTMCGVTAVVVNRDKAR